LKNILIRYQKRLINLMSKVSKTEISNPIKEDAPTCSMGGSSSVQGTGNISVFDKNLSRKPLKRFKDFARKNRKSQI
jgi:hypothetical protein